MKTMLITGATSGIGEALATLAAEKGYEVIACGRNQAKLQTLEQHPKIRALRFDVSDQEQAMMALKDIDCDIAVLNAGSCEYVDIESFEPKMFERVFQANFFGVVNSVAGLLPKLSKGDQLVIVDSLARLLPFTRSQAYGASKAALHYFTKSLDVDLSSRGIIVQSVSPGFVKTPLTDKNDFEMPMLISTQEAAKSILVGIEKKSASIYFPFIFSLILRVLGALFDSVKKRISLVFKQKSEK